MASPPRPVRSDPLREIAEAAAGARRLADYRAAVLSVLRRQLDFDAAIFHALSPRVPLSTGVVLGLDPGTVAASARGWDELADVLSPLREQANRDLVASDEVLSPRSAARRRLQARVLGPFGQRSLCIVHLVVRERVRAAVVLLSRRADAFPPSVVTRLRRLAPAIAVGDALLELAEGVPLSGAPRRLRCLDQRLTRRQREIVEHVASGQTNAEIGAALGLSPHSVRNHLARVFARLGAHNRADVVRRAVLLPEARDGESI